MLKKHTSTIKDMKELYEIPQRTQGHKGTKVQRYKGTKVQRHKGTKAQRYKGTRQGESLFFFKRRKVIFYRK